jgi:radical SAM superfamily enzyme YgiQ (UPF0313 family)
LLLLFNFMKIKLISPAWPRDSFWANFRFQFPIISLSTVAALTPSVHEVEIIDENVEPLDTNAFADLVGITAMTPLAKRAYEIADTYRARGTKVVLGGYHPTWVSQEAAQHADAVCIGEAEGLWPQILADFAAGQLKPYYRSETRPTQWGYPHPRRDLLQSKPYFFKNTMQTTRGCPYDCEFCAVTTFYGRTYRSRPVEDVIAEVKSLEGAAGFVVFVDDNIIGNPAYAKELFRRLIPLRRKWVSHASINIVRDKELLALAAQSGCYGLLIGFESLSPANIREIGKAQNKVEEYKEAVKKIHDHGIGIDGSFIFGFDEDNPGVFERTVKFIKDVRMDAANLFTRTPFPGTRLYAKMETNGQIIDHDWSHYDLHHVVFRPRNMTPEELLQGIYDAYKGIYSLPSIIKRSWPWGRRTQVFVPMNFGVRKASRKAGYF